MVVTVFVIVCMCADFSLHLQIYFLKVFWFEWIFGESWVHCVISQNEDLFSLLSVMMTCHSIKNRLVYGLLLVTDYLPLMKEQTSFQIS